MSSDNISVNVNRHSTLEVYQCTPPSQDIYVIQLIVNCIYLNRSLGSYFLQMIFDLAFKQVQCLFRPQCSFSTVHLSRVEWQVSVPVFTSLIVQLEANMFIRVYRHHSLTKRTSSSCWKKKNMANVLQMIDCTNVHKEDTHIKRGIKNKLNFLNV